MKVMDTSIDDDECTVEVVAPAKKKKMKQARLSFQSASKSPNSTNDVPNKKRKVVSPVEECKNPKVIKYTTEENSGKNKKEDTEEKLNTDSKNVEVILDEEEDLEENDQPDHRKNKKIDITPKRNPLGKNKRLDKSQGKPSVLTKFFQKADKKTESDANRDSNLCESKECQIIDEGDSEICNGNSNVQFIKTISECVSPEKEKLQNKHIIDHLSQESDNDIAVLSSDNEASSELDKSVISGNEERTDKPTTSLISKNDTDMKKKSKNLTAKQLEKRKEIAKRKEEKVKLKMEKEKKREEEKANRRREKEEKQREKEEKEKMEKEQKKKEKELKEQKKQMEIEQKQKEKEAKEEERRKREEAKEEEKRKKEEEKLEAERKKQKAASNFASFFVPKKQEVKSAEEESVFEAKNFMPFEIKADMKIAPVCRRTLSEQEKTLLDEKCNVDDTKRSKLYLDDVKNKRIVPRTSFKTWPLEAKDDDIVLLDEDNDGSSHMVKETLDLEKHRPKLLQFVDNRRPPYWGTWRKRSNIINSRRPFVKDEKWFDYEVDSDDEWEEEEPGESLKGSDDEKDEENPEDNEYDVDNEFMVPHGYLSDEEARADEEEMEDMSPQTQKMKLKLLGEQFEAERNAKTHKIKPKIIGCVWQGSGNSFPESVPTKVEEFLSARQAWVGQIPITLPSSALPENDTAASAECKTPTQQTPKQSGRSAKRTKFPNEALPDLIRLVHGNTHGRLFLMREFMTFWNRSEKSDGHQLSKASVLQKINELANRMACPEEGPMHLKSCWYVPEDIRKRYLPDDDLTLPNRWAYILTPSRKSDVQDVDKTEREEREKDKEKEKRHAPLITQFTKKITQGEMKKQLATKSDRISDAIAPKPPPLQRPPKRATLISVGRGEQFPEKSRESMLAKFVNLSKRKEEPSSSSEKMIADSDDDVILVESVDKNEKTGQKIESVAVKEKRNEAIVVKRDGEEAKEEMNIMIIDDA